MADTKTDSSSTPLSDDPANPTKGLSAKPNTASHPAGAEPALDTLFHRTSPRFCSASKSRAASQERRTRQAIRLRDWRAFGRLVLSSSFDPLSMRFP